jgi:hypothetical protein
LVTSGFLVAANAPVGHITLATPTGDGDDDDEVDDDDEDGDEGDDVDDGNTAGEDFVSAAVVVVMTGVTSVADDGKKNGLNTLRHGCGVVVTQ